MAISGQLNINIGLPNESTGSDSLYTAFNKVEDNFSNLFSCASPYSNIIAGNAISVTDDSANGNITIDNAGVTELIAGTGIVLSSGTGQVTISSTGGGGGGSVTSVAITPASSSRLTVSGSPIVSSGTIILDLATSGVVSGTYTYPTMTVDNYGRVTSISSGASVGTVTSVGLTPGSGIQVTGGPVTTSGTITVTNTGVTKLTAGSGIVLSGSNGNVTISSPTTGGTVTSVGISSGTLSVTGSPIVTSGVISIEIPNNLNVPGNLVTLGNITAGSPGKATIYSGNGDIVSLGSISSGGANCIMYANGLFTANNISSVNDMYAGGKITIDGNANVNGAIYLTDANTAAINFADVTASLTDTSMYYNKGSGAGTDSLGIALNGLDKIIIENAKTTVTDPLYANGGLVFPDSNTAAINFTDIDTPFTDTSIYYNDAGGVIGSDSLAIALNGTDKITIENAKTTVTDPFYASGGIVLPDSNTAAINFTDIDTPFTDTSIYYNDAGGVIGSDSLAIALNGADKITIENTKTTINDTLWINGGILLNDPNTAAINFKDVTGSTLDTAIYYNDAGSGIDSLTIALNASDKIVLENTKMTFNGGIVANASQTLLTTEAVNLETYSTVFTTSGASTATLAAGSQGQIKTFMMSGHAGDMVITVTNAGWVGAGTMTFSAQGQGCTLQYVSSKWYCVGNNGVTFA